jgi:hypothetical protein
MKTTLNKIRSKSPCTSGWTKLLKHLGKVQADDVELDLLTVLESNGLDDALWCLRAVDGFDKEKRLMAVAFAREVQHLMKDPRSIAALDVAERFANGEVKQEDLRVACNAAYNAAYASTRAAYAAYAAANAAHAAAYAAANAAANAAYAADADTATRAARAAAYADADAAAYVAARAAYDADDCAAMRNKQVQILKKFLEKS